MADPLINAERRYRSLLASPLLTATAAALFGWVLAYGTLEGARPIAEPALLALAFAIFTLRLDSDLPKMRQLPGPWSFVLLVSVAVPEAMADWGADAGDWYPDTAFRVWALTVMGHHVVTARQGFPFALGILAAYAPLVGGLAIGLVDGIPRQSGLMVNPSEVSQSGLVIWAAASLLAGRAYIGQAMGAIAIVAAGSRAGPVALWGWWAGRPSPRRLAAILAVSAAFVGFAWYNGNLDRLMPRQIAQDLEDRTALATAAAEQVGPLGGVATGLGIAHAPVFVDPKGTGTPVPPAAGRGLAGVGPDQLNEKLGRYVVPDFEPGQRPHNWPQLLLIQLGLFAWPVFGVALWAVLSRRVPLDTVLLLAPLAASTDEMVAVQQGHYMLAAILTAALAGARSTTTAP